MEWLRTLIWNILKSKTMWAAVLGLVAQILVYLATASPQYAVAIGIAQAVVALLLRFVTDKPIVPPTVSVVMEAAAEDDSVPMFLATKQVRDGIVARGKTQAEADDTKLGDVPKLILYSPPEVVA